MSVCFGRAIGISLWPQLRGSGREFDDFDLRRGPSQIVVQSNWPCFNHSRQFGISSRIMMKLLPFILLLTFIASDRHVYGAGADSASGTLTSEGAALFQELGCSGCHMGPSALRAPRLEGLYGKPVSLQDGSTVMADERYIRESILLPNSRIVAEYEPEMPSFAGQVTEDDLIRLIAYIKSLADETHSQ